MTTKNFINGAMGFFNAGQSGRWKGIIRKDDLNLFKEKIKILPETYVNWMLRD